MQAWARAVQQSWAWHIFLTALIMGGYALFHCADGAKGFSIDCLRSGAIAGGLYFFGAAQRAPGGK